MFFIVVAAVIYVKYLTKVTKLYSFINKKAKIDNDVKLSRTSEYIKIDYTVKSENGRNYTYHNYSMYVPFNSMISNRIYDIYGVCGPTRTKLNVEVTIPMYYRPIDIGFDRVEFCDGDEVVRVVEEREMIDTQSTCND